MLETCGVLTPIPVNSLPYQRLPAVGIAIDFPARLRYGMDNNRSWNMPWMLSLHGSFWARLHVFAAIREGINGTNTCLLQLFDSVAYWLVYDCTLLVHGYQLLLLIETPSSQFALGEGWTVNHRYKKLFLQSPFRFFLVQWGSYDIGLEYSSVFSRSW